MMNTKHHAISQKQLQKLHNQAVAIKRQNDSLYSDLSTRQMAIAQCAADLLENGDIVFINSSSTALMVYSCIQGKSLVIVTNNCNALALPNNPCVELILTGGEMIGNKQALVGELAMNPLTKITASKCILGTNGISAMAGISSNKIQETAVNRLMLKKCNGPKILVADGSKIGHEDNFAYAEINDITHLITDLTADDEELAKIRRAGVAVTIVDPANSH